MVSILCATLNHERFIRDALGGFLAQQCATPFEVVVRDDASTDGTVAIVQEFVDAYPGVVRLVAEPVNRWAEIKPIGALTPLARGEFVALCEGDDYWVDDERIDRQVAILRANPDAVLVYHDAVSVRGDEVVRESKLMPVAVGGMSGRDMLLGGMAPMPTMMYRNIDQVPVEFERHMLNFDQFLHVRLGRHGRAICEDRVGAVHRLHDHSAWFAATAEAKAEANALSREWIARWLDEVGETEAAAHFRATPRRKNLIERATGRARRMVR